jgi:hypothetical protein
MRRELIRLKTIKGAWNRAPWACKIVSVYGGFLAFESINDFNAWSKQS